MELMKLNEAEDIEPVPLFPVSLCEDNKQSLSPSICKDRNSHHKHVQYISMYSDYSWMINKHANTPVELCRFFLFWGSPLKQPFWDVLLH